jgi:hypothetical protein
MTEAEWFACSDPSRMLPALGTRGTDRKLRLLLVACARRVLPPAPDLDMLNALDAAERYADGVASKTELARARRALNTGHTARVTRWFPLYVLHVRSVPAWHAARDAVTRGAKEGLQCSAWSTTRRKNRGGGTVMTYPDQELAAQADLVRDIFCNPFRTVAFDPSWRTSDVVSLARHIYDTREYEKLPVLADALEDAGCHDGDVLAHCRQPAVHVRGCWLVDLVLGKS